MKNAILLIMIVWLFFNSGAAQYSETFDLPNKGILAGPCTTNDPTTCAIHDFAGVNWTIGGNLAGLFDAGDFIRTTGGVLQAVDIDEELCWQSPVLTMTGTASFALDLTWLGFDDYDDSPAGSQDYIDVSYRINGGAWIFIPNQVGGGPRTVAYLISPAGTDGSLIGVGATGLTGATLEIRVCMDANASGEVVTIDNVSAVNANDGSTPLVCDLMLGSVVAVPEDCTDANDGTITINATTTNGPINYSITGPVNANNSTGFFSGLPPGMYNIALQDLSFAPGTCTASSVVEIEVADDMTPPTATPPADVTVDCPVDIPAPNASLVTNIDDNCFIPCFAEPWINEFHYDNIGTDVNEFIEVAGPAGLDLSIYALYVYDGFDGTVYGTFPLTGIIPNQQNGYGTAFILTPNLQNTTEGIALVKNGTTVIEFISYEGILTATNGPAMGMSSVDVGVAETNDATPTNGSLGRVGAGNRPSGFNFAVLTQTQGTLNTGQTITTCPENVPTVVFFSDSNNGGSGSSGDPYIVTRTYRITDASSNTADIIQILTANACCVAPDADVTAVLSPVCPGEDAEFALTGTPGAEVTYNINGGSDLMLSLDAGGMGSLTVPAPVTNQTFNLISAFDPVENCTALLSGSATVLVEDTTPPTAICQNTTVALDNMGEASITPALINNNSTDNCGTVSLGLSQSIFTCLDEGANIVTLFVTDGSNNTGTCTATVTVEDNILPTPICQASISVELDANGMVSIDPIDIDDGSFDNCGLGIMLVAPNAFDCDDIGSNPVTLTVSDENGNSSSCLSSVTVEDNELPTALCQNIDVVLDETGQESILPAEIDAGSDDNCGILSMALSVTSFSCEDVGTNTVILTVTDVNNNVNTCSATVTVEDDISPDAICQNITVELDGMGQATITAAQVNGGSSDACGIFSLEVFPNSFNCDDVGMNEVYLTVTDENSNSSSCSAMVTVEDNILPTPVCQALITVELDANGMAVITPIDVNAGSYDNCGIMSMIVAPNTFDCDDVVGLNSVTLTVTDDNGNSDFCLFSVDVVDNEQPTALCQNFILELDEMGTAELNASDIDGGSFDNCVSLSFEASQESFDCDDVGMNSVILTVTDSSNNSSSCSAIVTVEDNMNPTATCINSIISFNGEDQIGLEQANMVTTDDNCGVQSIVYNPPFVSSSQVGETIIVTVTVTDVNGNSSQCTGEVFISGLPDGWSQDPDGVNCADGNYAEYDFDEEEFIVSSTNCYYASPYTSDQTAFVERELCGNGSITVQVTGITGGYGWAGIVMRESNAGGAKKFQLTTNLNSNFSRREIRTVTNGPAPPQQFLSFNRFWLRLVRQGNSFIGYTSQNGTNWYQVMAANFVMNQCIDMGMVVTNYNSNSTIVATFANVSYTEPMIMLPAGSANFQVSGVQSDFELYPNPASGGVFLDLNEYAGKPVQIEVHNINGQLIKYLELDIDKNATQFMDMAGYAAGLYLVKVRSENQGAVIKRFVLTSN